MQLIEMASRLFVDKLGAGGESLDLGAVQSALGNLLGSGAQALNLESLIGRFASADLLGTAKSWLGDGANQSLTVDQIGAVLGSEAVAEFAGRLGIGEAQAKVGLAEMIPELIDKASSGGSLLDSLGGASGLLEKLGGANGLLGAVGRLFK